MNKQWPNRIKLYFEMHTDDIHAENAKFEAYATEATYTQRIAPLLIECLKEQGVQMDA